MTEAQQLKCFDHTLGSKKTLHAKMGIPDGSSLVQMCIVKVAQNIDVLERKVLSEFYLQQK